jgi:hypothetical protein
MRGEVAEGASIQPFSPGVMGPARGPAAKHGRGRLRLKKALAGSKTGRKAFISAYRGTQSGVRLRRGLWRMLTDEPDRLPFFAGLLSSGDGK